MTGNHARLISYHYSYRGTIVPCSHRIISPTPRQTHSVMMNHSFVLALLESLLALSLSLPLVLLDELWWTVFNEITVTVDSSPLWKSVRNVHDSLVVEHVASVTISRWNNDTLNCCSCSPWLEVCLVLVGLQVNQAREEQDHVPSLVHDRTVAVVAANFARKLVLDRLVGRVVPLEVVVTV